MPVINQETLLEILDELKEQCDKTSMLIKKMDLEHKSKEEKEDAMGELATEVSILHTRSGLIEGYLDEF